MRQCFNFKSLALFILLFILIGSYGCNFKTLAYRHADWLLMHKADGYFDLTDAQEDLLEPIIDKHLDKIDQTFLPAFANMLEAFHKRLADGLDQEDLDFLREEYIKIRIAFFDAAASDISDTIHNLGEKQIQNFAEELKDDDEEYEDLLTMPEEKMQKKYATKKIKRIEEWFGDMSDDQLVALKKVYFVTREQVKDQYAVRLGFESAMIKLHSLPKAQTVAYIQAWARQPETVLPAAAAAVYLRSWDIHNQEFLQTDALMTKRQRQFFDKKFGEFVAELKAMKRNRN